MTGVRVGLAQINPTVGALDENAAKIIEYMRRAKRQGAELVVFPELSVTGYPPEDLLLKSGFIADNLKVVKEIARHARGISAVVGFVEFLDGTTYNAAGLLRDGRIEGVYRKMCLPNYGVFDEKRYFAEGQEPFFFRIRGDACTFGLTICEDMWDLRGKALTLCAGGCPDVIINISASPYHSGKQKAREAMLKAIAVKYRTAVYCCNLVGGQDELVFDGGSTAVDARGVIRYSAKRFEEGLGLVDVVCAGMRVFVRKSGGRSPRMGSAEEIYRSLVLGTGDYVRKNNFSKVIVGLSGGIDSSLTAKIACDAIGSENVIGVSMPSRYSSEETQRDARKVADNLRMRLITVPIDAIFSSYLSGLEREFKGLKPNIAEENLQARIRGNILMALSNKFGWLVLTTGNKSEISMGYCTLYGDMAGGFAPMKDVPKMLVYRLAAYVNARTGRKVMPDSVIRRAPTAELKDGQKDEDTLPPYRTLDPVLRLYIEEGVSLDEIVSRTGLERALVRGVVRTVDRNEYKRRQSPPGVKITPMAFGRDRRFPIVNKYRG